MTCDKVRFVSKKVADRALHHQQKWGAQVKRSYYCIECGGYHLTSYSKTWDNGGRRQVGIKKKRRLHVSNGTVHEQW